jgi:hypothetical protein
MMYLLVSQHVSGIIMPIIRRMLQNRQRLWATALVVLQKTRGEEVVGVHLLGMVSRLSRETIHDSVVKPFPTSAHQPPLLHESSAAQPVLYTIGVVGFVPFS